MNRRDMKLARPNRVSHSHTQTINGTPEEIFPLMCPVREIDWCRGWQPKLILSSSGLVEQDCIFVMPGEKEDTIWHVTRLDAEKFYVEMLMVTPGRNVGKLEITLRPDDADKTLSDVTYTHTSLGPDGDAFLKDFTRESYLDFMKVWEDELNHYLATGEMLAA